MNNLSLLLLGNPLVERDGHAVNVDRRKALALLAYLAVTGTTHRRDELATFLWPELDQTRARAALRRTLSTLNIALAGDWLQIDRETIRLPSSAAFRLDVTLFHDLLAQWREHGHSETEVCADCLRNLTTAAMLYRGDFLSGFTLRDTSSFDDWQFFQTETLRRELARVYERLAHGYSTRKDYDTAINYARHWLALDPLDEPAQCMLMQLYAWAGQRNAALRQYAECVRVLERELDIPPQAATTELFNAISENRLPPPAVEFLALAPITQAKESPVLNRDPIGYRFERRYMEVVAPAHDSLFDGIVRSRLVGREGEVAEIETLWCRATSGEGQILFISGEPGIGKTRLARELVQLAKAGGAKILTGGCYAEGGPPYAPLVELIREAFEDSSSPELPTFILADLLTLAPHLRPRFPQIPPNLPLAPEIEQQRVYDSFVTWCEILSAHIPLLLLVEDVHWADASTLALLRHLARRVQKARLLLVMTYRDTEVELAQTHFVNAILLELNRERLARHIKLARLSREQTRDLLATLLPTAGDITSEFLDSLYNETEGNPFFTEEVCKGLIQQGKLYQAGGTWRRADMRTIFIPPSVRYAIMARVDCLPRTAQEALRLAAILGREFDFETLRDASDQNEDVLITALERAAQAQLIEELPHTDRTAGRVTYTFVHALIPFALRENLGGLRRQRLHYRAGNAVEIRRPNDFEVLANHFAAAGMRGKAIEYSRRAAERAQALYAYDTAIQYLQTALDLMEAGEQNETRLILLESLADAHKIRGNHGEAIIHYQEALSLPHDLSNDANKWTAVRLHRKVGETFDRLGKADEIAQFNAIVLSGFENALKLIEGEPPHPESVRLLTSLANYGYWSSYEHYKQINTLSDKGEHYARAAVAMAEQLDTPVELSTALEALANFYSAQGMLHERKQIALRRLALSRDLRFTDRREKVNILCQLGLAMGSVGEYAQGLTYLLEAEHLANEVRDIDMVIHVLEMEAQCLFGLDRWDEISQVEDKGSALQARYGSDRVSRICRQCGVSAYIHGLRGEMELSRAYRQEAYNMMADAWGPLENWPAIGHF